MTKRLTDADPLSDADIDAMKRALIACRAESKGRDRQIFDMLSERPWARVGRFAAYSCQVTSLRLQPFELAPVNIRNIEAALQAPDDAAAPETRHGCCSGCWHLVCRGTSRRRWRRLPGRFSGHLAE